jgi:hypothetical protein
VPSGQAWRIYHTCLRRQKDRSLAKEPRLFLLPSLVPRFPRMSLLGYSVNKGNGAAPKGRAQAFYAFCATITKLRNLY